MFWPLGSNSSEANSSYENDGDKNQQLEGRSAFQTTLSNVVHSNYVKNVQGYLSWNRAVTDLLAQGLWFLGVYYQDTNTESFEFSKFLDDFESRIWFTYRKDFEQIGESGLNSDVGWGCMIRSGQMLLAQALVSSNLGRSWRLNKEKLEEVYIEIIQSFCDKPSPETPFSIHNFINANQSLIPGQWVGPSTICQAIKNLSLQTASKLLSMAVFIPSGDDNGGGAPILCLDSIVKLCLEASDSQSNAVSWRPVLILIPLMLGSEKINPRYLPSLKQIFTFPQSLGILGGRPGGANYLVGVQGEDLVYLDPHHVQNFCEIQEGGDKIGTGSYHCREPKKMALDSVDPSLALAFLCCSQDEFEDFCEKSQQLMGSSMGAPLYTIGTLQNNTLTLLPSSGQVCQDKGEDEEDDLEEDWQIVRL